MAAMKGRTLLRDTPDARSNMPEVRCAIGRGLAGSVLYDVLDDGIV